MKPVSGAAKPSRASSLRGLLSGGDRRSIAKSNLVRDLVRDAPARVAELAALTTDHDWLVSMRALDLLEKIAHEQADLVQPFKAAFLGPLAESDKWEIRLQIVRALPLLEWTPDERTRAIQILRQNVEYPQTFVRAWALDSLATFAIADPRLMRLVRRSLRDFDASGSKALQARARNIRARLADASGRTLDHSRRSGSGPSTTVANERTSEPTRAEWGVRGPHERACRGVRGAKPLG